MDQQDRLAAFTLMVTVLDQAHAGLASAVIDERTAKLAEASSRARGYLDGRSLAEVFAWLRPNDLIWNYWVNNYLLGKKPAPFDILFWNADTTRMTAGLHRDFLELGAANALVTPGTATMLGSPVDLGAVDKDSYIVAGITDHICPWQSCYRTTQLLGGRPRFLLSTSWHVAAMVNPPGNEAAAQEWLRGVLEEAGFECELLAAVEGRPNLIGRLRSGSDGPALCLLGHIGDGNFHLILLLDENDPDEIAAAEAINERMVHRALAMDGTCTGEHGVGLGKQHFLEAEHGPALNVMRAIKAALDPNDILNPGKMLPAPEGAGR